MTSARSAPWRERTSSAMCWARVSGAERRLAEDDLADRLVDDLVEARHVRALLVAAEVDETVEPGEEELVANPHHLLDARDPDAGEPDGHARHARLDVVTRTLRGEDRGGGPCRLHRGLA